MKITRDYAEYAATLTDPEKRAIAGADAPALILRRREALSRRMRAERGMAQMSEKFRATGELV